MAYADLIKQPGRQPATIVRIYVDRCQNEYGDSFCGAGGVCEAGIPACPLVNGPDGTPNTKCYRTFATCQDQANYDQSTLDSQRLVMQFASTHIRGLQQPGEPPIFPTLQAISMTPTQLNPGKGFGVRSTINFTVGDMPYTGSGVDPYHGERTIDFMAQGTLLGRFLARNQYLEGARVQVLQGYLENGIYVEANFRSRTYLIERVTRGKRSVQFVAKDPLKLADDERAQWPRPSKATMVTALAASTPGTSDTFTVADPDGDLTVGFVVGQVWMAVDDEPMEITAIAPLGGGQFSVTANRASLPSIYPETLEAPAHDTDAGVQPCYYFDDQRIDDVLQLLLVFGAGVDYAFLDLPGWQTVIDNGLQSYTLSRLLVEPTGVRELISELSELTLFIWWDERAQLIRMDSILQKRLVAGPYGEDSNILIESVSVADDPKGRISQVHMSLGFRSPFLDEKKPTDYQRTQVQIDLDAESTLEYGTARVKTIRSQWLPLSKVVVANEIVGRLLAEFRDTKHIIQFELDARDDEQWTGDVISAITKQLQDEHGIEKLTEYRIIEVNEITNLDGVKYRITGSSLKGAIKVGVIAPIENPEDPGNPFPDHGVASESLKRQYAFIAPDSGVFGDGSPAYQIQ